MPNTSSILSLSVLLAFGIIPLWQDASSSAVIFLQWPGVTNNSLAVVLLFSFECFGSLAVSRRVCGSECWTSSINLKAVVGSQGFPMQNGVISRQIFCILVWYILLFFPATTPEFHYQEAMKLQRFERSTETHLLITSLEGTDTKGLKLWNLGKASQLKSKRNF